MAIFDRQGRNMKPLPEWVVADFNEVDDISPEYRGYRYVKDGVGLPARDLPAELSARLLREAADAIEANPNDGSDAAVRAMADVYCFLATAQRMLPEVDCWVVTKNYEGKTQAWHDAHPGGSWTPAGWCGSVYEAHANDLRDALEKHYDRKYARDPDTWTVARGTIGVTRLIRPDVSAEQYVKYLGR